MAEYDNKVLTGSTLTTLVTKVKQADDTKQPKITLDSKLNPQLVGTNTDYQFVSATEKSTWNNKANASDIPDDLADLREDSTHRLVTDAEKTAWNGKADSADIPTALADLTADATHRLVTDTEKTTWSGKADLSDIPDELADLTDDATHRLVTDTEKATWDGKTDMAAVEAKGYQTASQVTSTVEGYGYQTAAQVNSAISTAIAGITTFGFEIVQALPTTDISTSTIYLVPKSSSSTDNVYTEYAYVNSNWEILGDTAVTIDTLTNAEVETIWNSVT